MITRLLVRLQTSGAARQVETGQISLREMRERVLGEIRRLERPKTYLQMQASNKALFVLYNAWFLQYIVRHFDHLEASHQLLVLSQQPNITQKPTFRHYFTVQVEQ